MSTRTLLASSVIAWSLLAPAAAYCQQTGFVGETSFQAGPFVPVVNGSIQAESVSFDDSMIVSLEVTPSSITMSRIVASIRLSIIGTDSYGRNFASTDKKCSLSG